MVDVNMDGSDIATTETSRVVLTGWEAIPARMIIYVVEGSLQLICNALVAAAIFRTARLRCKEYYVIAALAVADASVGLAYLSAGLFRIMLFYQGRAHLRVLIGDCYLAPHTSLLIFSQPWAAMMLVCVSIDRLIAVVKPLKYYGLTTLYSRNLIGSFTVVSLVSSAALIASSFWVAHGTPATSVATCGSTGAVHSEIGKQFYFALRAVSGVVSVLLFLLVPVAYRHNKRKTQHNGSIRNSQQEKQESKLQRRLMVTVGLSTLCTFLFYVCPNLFSVMSVWFTAGQTIREYLAIVQNLNSLFNIVFYFTRHTDIREGIIALVFCQKPNRVASISQSQSRTAHSRSVRNPTQNA